MPKPSSFAAWTVGNGSFVTTTVEPSAPKKVQGWLPDEFPPCEYHNWLFYNADQWAQWNARAGGADFVVGDNAIDDFTTLAAAVSAAVAGQTIRVKKSLVLAATLVITLDNLRILLDPGITITKGAATTGIQITSDGVRIDGGRMAGYTVIGDVAIAVAVGANYCSLHGLRFEIGTNTDVSDLSGTASVTAKINE